ncbi:MULTISPECIES: hypothetical protein [unclassified Novosphingobium]|uniref:hypothetical protein n=1 Tax=unclassified Novosphingobium TaxID=2644732 RepID=UPI000EC3E32C|nr:MULTISPECIES: hypothetical protein [unclassified Novosphingobium]HCF24577.1 hypothetical protein [Novosphingobium sp.]HQV03673.1 hypothetical protein [Novosphingobium sp.]
MNRLRMLLVLAALTCSGGSAMASIQSGWPLLAFAREAGCELQIVGNGKFLELRGSGFVPGESLSFSLTNGDIKPLARQAFADGSGRWTKLYIPFRFGQPGGTVNVALSASRCTMTAGVPWQRLVRVID